MACPVQQVCHTLAASSGLQVWQELLPAAMVMDAHGAAQPGEERPTPASGSLGAGIFPFQLHVLLACLTAKP